MSGDSPTPRSPQPEVTTSLPQNPKLESTPEPSGMTAAPSPPPPTTTTSEAMDTTALTPPDIDDKKYGGFTRFEIELEFVQTLANPMYLNFLASEKYFEKPEFVAYLDYLQYFTRPPYLQYLTYPGATLNNLMLLQREKFRTDILSPDVTKKLAEEILKASSAQR